MIPSFVTTNNIFLGMTQEINNCFNQFIISPFNFSFSQHKKSSILVTTVHMSYLNMENHCTTELIFDKLVIIKLDWNIGFP